MEITSALPSTGIALRNLFMSVFGRRRAQRKVLSDFAEEVLCHITEGSILHAPDVADYVPYAVAGRKRRATCSGDAASGVIEPEPFAQWKAPGLELAGCDLCCFFPMTPSLLYRILVVDQGADSIPVFEFDGRSRKITRVGDFAVGLDFPHGVDVAPDGRYVAITNYGDDTVRVLRVKLPFSGTLPINPYQDGGRQAPELGVTVLK